MDGWVKLWRKSVDSGLIKNHNVWIFWTYCLMKANHERDYKQVIGFQEIILRPGQFVFGRKKASEETGLSEQKIRTCLVFLKKYKNLTIKTTNKFSIISIINWERYQNQENEINQQINQHVTSSQPAGNHKQEPKNKRTKELKRKDKKKIIFSPPSQIEVENYFSENGYTKESGSKAFNFYNSANWIDSKGNQVKNWKQKMIGVWFKDENKKQSEFKPIPNKEEIKEEFKKKAKQDLDYLAMGGNIHAFEELRRRGEAI